MQKNSSKKLKAAIIIAAVIVVAAVLFVLLQGYIGGEQSATGGEHANAEGGIFTRMAVMAQTGADRAAQRCNRAIALTEGYADFFNLMQLASSLAFEGEYEQASDVYRNAADAATAISHKEGRRQAMDGVWRVEYHLAYMELRVALLKIAQEEAAAAAVKLLNSDDETSGNGDDDGSFFDDAGASNAPETIYDYNLSIDFDMATMIDRQNIEPASLVRMGSVDDRNEGWYNGCGWIATYNMLIKLGEPRHPADIARYFELSGGTVLDGVFGTYPRAIENYLKTQGFDVNHTFMPGAVLSIDGEIKSAGLGILAYLHTSGAHYVMIEYRESDGRYIVYNDSLARARSRGLELSELSDIGAVIDSVEAWLAQAPEILFPFSLITA